MPNKSLNELMGAGGDTAKGRKLTLDDLHELLGEKLPVLPRNAIGRMRLTNALMKRFGQDYRQLRGIDDILKEFDDEAAFNVRLMQMKQLKGK